MIGCDHLCYVFPSNYTRVNQIPCCEKNFRRQVLVSETPKTTETVMNASNKRSLKFSQVHIGVFLGRFELKLKYVAEYYSLL